MTTIHVNLPDYLAKLAEEAAQTGNVTVDQIVAMALSAHVSGGNFRETIESTAERGSSDHFKGNLAKVRDRPPRPGDEA